MRQGVLDADVPGGDVGRVQMRVHREHRAGHGRRASDLPAREDRPGEAPVQLRTDEGHGAGGDVAGTRNAIQKSSGGRGIQSSSERRRSLLRGEDVKALQRVYDRAPAPQYGPPIPGDIPGEAQPRSEIFRLGLIGPIDLLPHLHHSQVPSKLASWLWASWIGVTNSYRSPRFRVNLEEMRQSSCTNPE